MLYRWRGRRFVLYRNRAHLPGSLGQLLTQVFCVLDYETFSEADLKRVGAFEYSAHPSTEILCAAWQVGTRETLRKAPVEWWAPGLEGGNLAGLIQAVADPSVVLVAHNAYFEQVITRNVFAARYMYSMRERLTAEPKRWVCTASLAAALAVPRNLEGAAMALRLTSQKDMDGRRLVLKWCKPRKPTKADSSTRHTDLNELKRLVEYCQTDVKTETELFLTCPPLPRKERRVWVLDQTINLRGVLADTHLVDKALGMIAEETELLNSATKKMSGLKSATQRDAVLSWLEGEGAFLPNLKRKTVEDAVKDGLVSGRALEMLNTRLAISKTSTAKYIAFKNRSRFDGRVRDTLQYHAAATGRWGGSGVQLQNLPRPSIKDTVQAAEIIKEHDLETVRLIYGAPMDVFSSVLRGVLVAPPGYVLDVADYAAIEARVLFWVAGHHAGIKAFVEGRDLYREMAADVFGKKLASIEKDSFDRFIGKQVILGCFGADTKVLTDSGWKPIVKVLHTDKVWDGEEWVNHGGVICQGEKTTIDLAGIRVTPDHRFLLHGNWVTASEIAQRHLLRLALDTGFSGLKRMTLGSVAGFKGFGFLARVTARLITPLTFTIFGAGLLPAAISALKKLHLRQATQNITGFTKALYRTASTELGCLTAYRRQLAVATSRQTASIPAMADGEFLSLKGGKGIGRLFSDTRKHCRGGMTPILKWTESTMTGVMSRAISVFVVGLRTLEIGERLQRLQKKSNVLSEKCITFDIAEAGPRNRFTVLSAAGPLIAHNCGYGLGFKKFMAMILQLSGKEITEALATRAVNTYREKHKPVVTLWGNLERAAMAAIENPGKTYKLNKTAWSMGRVGKVPFLFCELPSGRRLAYCEPRIETVKKPWGEPGPAMVYSCVNGKTKKWGRESTYGGALTENVVQAIARDLMAEAMLRIDADGRWRVVLSVHDELVGERDVFSGATNKEFCDLMATLPDWAAGCPVTVEGFETERYRK